MKFIKSAWESWKRIAHKIFMFQTAVVMTIFYFTVVAIGAAGGILLRKDLLHTRKTAGSTYIPHQPAPDTVERYMHLS